MVNHLQKIAQEKIEQYQELVDSIIQLIILHEYDNIIQSDDKDSLPFAGATAAEAAIKG